LIQVKRGGAIGAWLAIRHPELVESLVLSAPAAFVVNIGLGRAASLRGEAALCRGIVTKSARGVRRADV
jgi:pimeloyl-ACP methyl ester carboxylesterase